MVGFLAAAAPILGAVGGGVLQNYFTNQQKDDDIDRYKAMGLTPTEIAGVGGIGSSSSSAGQVLGNSASQIALQSKQIAAQKAERQKDREVELAKAQISAGATLGSSAQSAAASRYGANLQSAANMARIEMDRMRLPAELSNLANQNATSSPEFVRYLKMLSMSPANVAAANAAIGLPFDPLDPAAVSAASPAQRAEVLQILVAMSSNAYREAVGATEVVKNSASGYRSGLGALSDYFRGTDDSPTPSLGSGGRRQNPSSARR